MRVDARDSEGDITPNFGRENSAENIRVYAHDLVWPAGGALGSGGDVGNGTQFSLTTTPGKFENSQVTFDEFGSIRLRAEVSDGNYLGSGAVVGTVSGTVGRFGVAEFVVDSATVTPGCTSFTYLGANNLGLDYEIQARASYSNRLSNYDATLLSDPLATIAMHAENANAGTNLASRLSADSGTWSSGRYAVSVADATIARIASADGPFSALQLGAAVTDTIDGAMLANRNMNAATATDCDALDECDAVALGAPSEFVYGRALILPDSGPEDRNLELPIEVQYFDGSQYVLRSADNCTTYAPTDFALANYEDNLDDGETLLGQPVAPFTFVGGRADTSGIPTLTAPGFNNDGSLAVTLDVPDWLKFDWLGTGDQAASARFSFGSYRGHDRIIFWRERF